MVTTTGEMESYVRKLKNSELRKLIEITEHELHLSERCIEEGEEVRE